MPAETQDPERRTGVEIEFAGLDAIAAAEAIAAATGGRVEVAGPHRAAVCDHPLGRLRLELDTRFAKPTAKDPDLIDRALDALEARSWAADIISYLAPVELITEPIDRAGFAILDRVIAALRGAGARGTRDSPFNAFGLHLNPELDPPEPARMIRVAAAFAYVEPWLRHQIAPDPSRRLSPFVDPWPPGFVLELARLTSGGEVPELERFVALYAAWNPDRNRGLDLWPLIGWLAPEAAERHHRGPVHGPRPTFHYRLPDAAISDPLWSPRHELDRWERIEALAARPRRLESARRLRLAREESRLPWPLYLDRIADLMR